MKNPELFSENGSKEDLTMLFLRYNCSVMEIQDVIEDSESGAELTAKMNKLKLFSKFTLDRETPTNKISVNKIFLSNMHRP